MDIAERIAEESRATRLKVGSVIVKKGNIIAFGWNGTISGCSNEMEENFLVNENGIFKVVTKTKPSVVHSEQNSIIKLARDGHSGKNAVLFCSHSPCLECSKLIAGVKIKAVYYRHLYRNQDGLEFLKTCGVKIIQVL
jgi:dCMP deaminase